MSHMYFLLILGIVLFLLALLLQAAIRRGASSQNIILFGINVTIFGGIVALTSEFDLMELKYIIAFSGVLISVVGILEKR